MIATTITAKIHNRKFFGEFIFAPLENGRCEYVVACHDFGNLESLVNRVLSYKNLNYYLENPERYIKENK